MAATTSPQAPPSSAQATAAEVAESRRGRALFFFVLSLLYVLAVFSFDPADNPAVEGGLRSHRWQNMLGALGAHTAHFSFISFGLCSYPLALLMCLSTLRRSISIHTYRINYLYVLALAFTVIGLCITLTCMPGWTRQLCGVLNLRELPGGAVGSILCHPQFGWLNNLLSNAGSIVIGSLLAVYGLYVIIHFDYRRRPASTHPQAAEPVVTTFRQISPQAPIPAATAAPSTTRRIFNFLSTRNDKKPATTAPTHASTSEFVSAFASGDSEDVVQQTVDEQRFRPQTVGLAAQPPPQAPRPAQAKPLQPELISLPEPEPEPAVAPDILAAELSEAATARPAGSPYRLPGTELLTKALDNVTVVSPQEIARKSEIIDNTLKEFNLAFTMGEVFPGPRVTLFEVVPGPGVLVNKFEGLKSNLAMNLQAQKGVRFQSPIPGRRGIGIEVPNEKEATVSVQSMFTAPEYARSKALIPIVLGKDIGGKVTVMDLAKAPHLLVAGATGAGKSVFMNTLILSLLYRFSPQELELILVDPKQVEFAAYKTLPHLVTPVITNPEQVGGALRWAILEMESRYQILAAVGVKNLEAFNSRSPRQDEPKADADGNLIPTRLPMTVIIIDEMADIMQNKKIRADVETSVSRLAAKARAVGIHLVVATQRPSVDVITGVIKANFPTRIAFQVTSVTDSRTILDQGGADSLLGRGDMLFLPPGASALVRIQAAYAPDDDIDKVVAFSAAQAQPRFRDIVSEADSEAEAAPSAEEDAADDRGEESLIRKAIEIIRSEKKSSISYIQRRLGVGYNKAANIIEDLEQRGYLSPVDSQGKREIIWDNFK